MLRGDETAGEALAWVDAEVAGCDLGDRGLDAILSGHFAATAARCATCDGPLLVFQDTTEFVYKWGKLDKLGAIGSVPARRDRDGKPRMYTQCGLLMHSSLAVTTEGLPLGLVAARFWTRDKLKGTNALKRRVNPTRVPIEQKESMRRFAGPQAATPLIGTPDSTGTLYALNSYSRNGHFTSVGT